MRLEARAAGRTEAEAVKKVREKGADRLQSLDPALYDGLAVKETSSVMTWGDGPEMSSYGVFRGGTRKWLHISEWAELQVKARERSGGNKERVFGLRKGESPWWKRRGRAGSTGNWPAGEALLPEEDKGLGLVAAVVLPVVRQLGMRRATD